MARGIDFKAINLVINYDFPNQMLTYIHRVGRTGRAGAPGRAITFFTDEDKPLLRTLANVLKISGCQVPDWIFELKTLRKDERKFREKFPVKRESITEAQPFYVPPFSSYLPEPRQEGGRNQEEEEAKPKPKPEPNVNINININYTQSSSCLFRILFNVRRFSGCFFNPSTSSNTLKPSPCIPHFFFWYWCIKNSRLARPRRGCTNGT